MTKTDMSETPCLLCGAPSDRVVISENGFQAKKCDRCSLIWVSPRPAAPDILGIYEHDESELSASQHIAMARSREALAYSEHTLKIIQRHLVGVGSILEIGGGSGLFLDVARGEGFDVAAIEPNPVQASFMRDNFEIECETEPLSDASFRGRKFNVVYHRNVLSHFYDPILEFQKIRHVLTAGGLMVFETGNFADVAEQYYELIQKTERFQLPEHLFFFGEKSLKEALDRAGFETKEILRYSRIPEKYAPGVLKRIPLWKMPLLWRINWSHFIKYGLGRIFPKGGRPQTLIVVARAKAI